MPVHDDPSCLVRASVEYRSQGEAMGVYAFPILLMFGMAVAAAAVWVLRGRDVSVERQRAERAEMALREEQNARATLDANIETKLKALAADALRDSNQSFLLLAAEVFDKHRSATDTLLNDKEKAIERLLAPINESLTEYRKGLSEIEKAREAAYGGLRSQLMEVGRETRQLATALRSAPQTRGRWGELQIKNVIELAGMTAYVDYVPQQTIAGSDGRIRPDVIIRVPGDRRIVVDVKTPLLAYLDAIEATNEGERESHLKRHAQQLRTHMKQLSDKKYWEALLPLTPDYVIMFIPGENFYSAAIERDRELFEDAIAARVLIVTPTTMIALAKTIANGWDQQKLAVEAQKIAELGRDLYKRLSVMGGHILQLGRSIHHTVDNYNKFIGSIETSVMPKAREFEKMPIGRTLDPFPHSMSIDIDTREPRADRDLIVSGAEALPLRATRSSQAAE
jgi:DNA recombination protein RmuC